MTVLARVLELGRTTESALDPVTLAVIQTLAEQIDTLTAAVDALDTTVNDATIGNEALDVRVTALENP